MIRVNRQVVYVLCIIGGVWFITMVNMLFSAGSYQTGRPSHELQADIVRLSEQYVRQLAKETQNTVDGPFAARLTGYDMKKTMAVLLEELVQRVDHLETRLQHLAGNGSVQFPYLDEVPAMRRDIKSSSERRINVRDLILGAQEDCSLSAEQRGKFPHCEGKTAWMRDHWKSDSCYNEYGVDGTECSIRVYLSEVESWCPLLPGRTKLESNVSRPEQKIVDFNFDLELLLKKMENPGTRPNYNWIRDRVSQMWPAWVKSGKSLQKKYNMTTGQKKILVHLGFLSQKSGFKMAENSLRGGPLGELVQWSDIICTLYILGHDITITSEYDQLAQILSTLPTAEQQCQYRGALPIDMIFSDIVGLSQFKRKVKNGYGKFSCILRVVDSFGTEPAYNYEPYAKGHRLKTSWGMQNLDPRQFYTMFPHSPDNSFMGFVIDNHLNSTQAAHFQRKNVGVVYGKAEYMWLGKESYLEVIRQYVDIHATVYTTEGKPSVDSVVPNYVTNHGVLPGAALHRLLHESKLFIGLGFPYEGPAPLEAIAQGCVFINPQFSPPHSSKNTKFFKGKPTRRQVTSQHPYAEVHIGPPHVHTVDIDDKDALHKVLQQAISDIDAGKVNGFIPYEFTQEGMLQRLNAYIAHQDFCDVSSPQWPEAGEVTTVLAPLGQACSDACWGEGRVCEPSYFSLINSADALNSHLTKKDMSCSLVTTHEDIYYPAFRPASKECVVQAQPLLFSCVGESKDFIRLCPCRTYIKEQMALCEGCV